MFSTELAEIVLIVEDVERSARFYREVVGLTPENEPENDWAWFWAGEPGRTQRVALHKGPLLFEESSPLPEGERGGKIHYAFNVPRDRLEAAVDNAREKGTEVYGPDGNLLEFWSPDPSAALTEPQGKATHAG